MSEKKDEEDEEQKTDIISNEDLEKSNLFGSFAEQVFKVILSLYQENESSFYTEEFPLYDEFLPRFMPAASFDPEKIDGNIIRTKISSILEMKRCKIFASIVENGNVDVDKLDVQVSGILYVKLRGIEEKLEKTQIFINDPSCLQTCRTSFFTECDPSLSIGHSQSARSFLEAKEAGRLIISLSLSPDAFWRSDLFPKVMELALSCQDIIGIKLRSVPDFRRDTIILYSTAPTEKLWSQIGDKLTKILRPAVRSDLTLPFAVKMSKGILANIAPYIIVEDDLKQVSFTHALALMAQTALMETTMAFVSKNEESDAVEEETKQELADQSETFKTEFARLFKKNNLYLTKDGMMRQDEPPQI